MENFSHQEIDTQIKNICEKSLIVEKCLNDVDYLCEVLNSVDKNLIVQYFRSDREGPVVDIRKEVAKNILLSDISPETLNEIILKHKTDNSQRLKSWNNPYKILHPLVNQSFSEIDEFIQKFTKNLSDVVGGVKTHIVNFNGPQNQGTDKYWFALYNENHSSQQDGLQLFFTIKSGEFSYGIYKHLTEEFLVGPINYTNVEEIFRFIEENKNLIHDDEIRPKMSFLEAAKFVLEQNENSPMTASEIWNEISNQRLVSTTGKTPHLSLNSIISSHSVNLEKYSPDRKRAKFEIKNSIFKIVSNDPYKFQLVNFMPSHIKRNLIENGFITMDMLVEILNRNGIKLDI